MTLHDVYLEEKDETTTMNDYLEIYDYDSAIGNYKLITTIYGELETLLKLLLHCYQTIKLYCTLDLICYFYADHLH